MTTTNVVEKKLIDLGVFLLQLKGTTFQIRQFEFLAERSQKLSFYLKFFLNIFQSYNNSKLVVKEAISHLDNCEGLFSFNSEQSKDQQLLCVRANLFFGKRTVINDFLLENAKQISTTKQGNKETLPFKKKAKARGFLALCNNSTGKKEVEDNNSSLKLFH